MNLQEKVLGYKDDVVREIQGAIQIPSVMEEAKPGMPFGEGPAKALNYFVELGKKLGFKVVNYDNYAAEIEFGEGEEVLGILGHVDVVPEGEDWLYPPYSGTIADGKIFGRGTLDDKGPAVICLYAMKTLLDSGIKLNRKVRMILGANEESGSKCMKYYFNTIKRPQPTLAFTPDSSFPVTFAEKGIIRISLTKNYNNMGDIVVKGGNAFNSVPQKTHMTISKDELGNVEEALKKYNADHEYKIECELKDGKYNFLSLGKAAHGSRPYKGYNSASALFTFLNSVEVKNADLKDFLGFYSKYIGMETDGKSLGINFHDEDSGNLTLNVGKVSIENGKVELSIDMRCPVSISNDKVIETIKETIKEDAHIEVLSSSKALYVAKDSFLVSTLMDVYRNVTGDVNSQPVAIGGGTYARQVTNGVAFGALLASQEDNMHQKNEYLEIDKIDTLLKIYVEAIYQLAK